MLINDEHHMQEVGKQLAAALQPADVVFLQGDLAAGKTTLSRFILLALGHHGVVKSPTYTLVEEYDLAIGSVYHFDLYRVQDVFELDEMGIRDYFHEDSICLVEWPERAQNYLPKPTWLIKIEHSGLKREVFITHKDVVFEI
jgi:tRNA threonylcarbamoyladenosine biosynthesis protein TsaE